MTAPALPPEVIEKATRAVPLHRMVAGRGSQEEIARAVLAAVADDLRAEGAQQVRDAVEAAYPLPDRVEIDYEGTCEGCAEDKHLVASYPEPDNEPWLCAECDADMRAPITAAREAVTRIENAGVRLPHFHEVQEWKDAREQAEAALPRACPLRHRAQGVRLLRPAARPPRGADRGRVVSTFEARYPGRCGLCDEAIRVGDTCAYIDDEVAHAQCPEPAATAEPCPRCWLVPAANGSCGCES